MDYSFWPEFGVLMAGGVIGSLALIPYSLRLIESSAKKKRLKMKPLTLALLSFLQNILISAISVGVGLLLSHKINLGAPSVGAIVNAQPVPYSLYHVVTFPAMLGAELGIIIIGIDLIYLPHWPKQILSAAKKTSLAENFYASFYGGFNEEYLARLFGVSLFAWLLSRVWHGIGNNPPGWAMWLSIVLMSVLFALGHLPALKTLTGKVSGVMLSRTLVLNIPLAFVCGWLFWKYGIEAAIIAHFSADIIYHVGGTLVLRANHPRAGQ